MPSAESLTGFNTLTTTPVNFDLARKASEKFVSKEFKDLISEADSSVADLSDLQKATKKQTCEVGQFDQLSKYSVTRSFQESRNN